MLGDGDRRLRERVRARPARDRRRCLARQPPVPRPGDPGGERARSAGAAGAAPTSRWPRAAPMPGVIGAAVLAAQEVGRAEARYSNARRDNDRKGRMTTGGSQLDELSHQHDPHARDGRRAEGEVRPPGRPDGTRPARLPALHARHEAQPRERGLVRPRPLHPLGRPRVDAALRVALPVRLRADARRPQELPPARQPDRRAPRARRRGRDRGHHRPARPGHLDGRRPRARRGDAGRPLQPPRPRPDRPPHLRDRQRRRHPGGRGLRGLLAGRPPRARQARPPSTTTTTSSSPARPRWRSPRTCRKRFEAYGWHVQDLGEDLELERHRARRSTPPARWPTGPR